MVAIKKEERKVGSISFSNGKGTIQLQTGPVPFDMSFVIDRIRKAARNSRPGFYRNRLRAYCKELELSGVRAIPSVENKLRTLNQGNDVNHDFFNTVTSWFNTLSMFTKMKSGGNDRNPARNWNKNFDHINWSN